MANKPQTVLIGGFAFNLQCFEFLKQSQTIQLAIDINLFAAELSLELMVDEIASRMQVSDSWQIIAYSSGGLFAILLAHKYPQLVCQLILLNSTPCFIEKNAWRGIKPANAEQLRAKLKRQSLPEFMYSFALLANYPQAAANYQSYFSRVEKSALLNLLQIIINSDLRLELAELTMPINFIYSQDDVLVPVNKLTNTQQFTLIDSNHLEVNQAQLATILKQQLCHPN